MNSDADTLNRLVSARFSCRAYLPDPLPDDLITEIVRTARHAPSWCNAQPWHLTITKGGETDRFREALYDHVLNGGTADPDLPHPSSYPDVYGERRRACGWQLYEAVGVEKGDRAGSAKQMMENFRLFGAPHVAILHTPRALGHNGAMDCGGFVNAFCTAATARDVATIPQAAVVSYAAFVREWFGLGDDRMLLCAISFGRADMDHSANTFRTDRADPADLIDWRS